MKFPQRVSRRVSYLRSAKFGPFAIISVFFLFNFTGFFFSPVMAPVVDAVCATETIAWRPPEADDGESPRIVRAACGQLCGLGVRRRHG